MILLVFHMILHWIEFADIDYCMRNKEQLSLCTRLPLLTFLNENKE